MFTQLKVKGQTLNQFSSMILISTPHSILINNVFLLFNKIIIKYILLKQLSLLLMICGLLDVILVKLYAKLQQQKQIQVIWRYFKDLTLSLLNGS
jgi:hypothetical protein